VPVVRAANRLFQRDDRCATCPNTLPPCDCSSTELCQETSRNCTTCASRTCISNVSSATVTAVPGSSGGSSSPNVGAIAGGVVGGLAALALIGFLIYWFVIRKRRQMEEREKTVTPQNAQARRSVASVASTVMTRASNVIQIAYIPGVTNRSPPDTPGTLVPPVPPIPSAYPSAASTPAYAEDQHFFMPGDIRDSRYSNMTVDRRSIATSLARSSVATTIYRSNAIVSPIPAQKAFGGKAAVVSVGSGSSTPNEHMSPKLSDAPAVPAITEAQLTRAGMASSSIIARSVIARPVNVTKKASRPKVPTLQEESHDSGDSDSSPSSSAPKDSPSRATGRANSNESNFESSSDDEEDHSHRQMASASSRPKIVHEIDGSSSSKMGPFSDQQPTLIMSQRPTGGVGGTSSSRQSHHSKTGSSHRQRSSAGSNRLREEAAANSANLTATKRSGTERSDSPFSDAHAVGE
jgi:protein OPY2